MPDTYQTYDITMTGNGHTLDLTFTVDTSQTDKIDTQYSDNSGNPVTAISGTLDGAAITGLVATNTFLGNDNLYVAGTTTEPLDYSGISFTVGTTDYNLFYHVGGPDSGWTLDDGGKGGNSPTHVISGSGVTFTITPVCFVTGTLIATTRGEVAVEDLKVGDLAVTAAGEARPIVWLGSKRIEQPARSEQPVRVMAGAFGENRPVRDLFLSPGHAVCVNVMDEVFVPVGELVNGATIVREQAAEVTYWHVELESHDVLLAEGLGCESYMDAGNRTWFVGGEGAADPERVAESLEAYARPFVAEGAIVEAVRQRLTARAETLGWTRDCDMDLHLMVDGQRVAPVVDGDLARFIFPAKAESAVLVSQSFSPSWTGGSQDRRDLGVMVRGIDISDGLRVDRRIALDDAALGAGFHPLEHIGEEAVRWTDGQAQLPAALWEGCKGQVVLRLAFDPAGGWSWAAPALASEAKVIRLRAA